MSNYKCVFYDEYNKRQVQRVCLDSEEDVVNYAIEKNLKIASIKEDKISVIQEEKISYKDLRVLCSEIGILLESGCEITKLFELVKLNSNKRLTKTIEDISINIQKGSSISKSFQKTNKFSKFFTSMIKTGEVSGNLDIVMLRLSEYYEKEHKLKSKIKGMLIYPLFLVVTSIIVALFMFIVIIPNYQVVFLNNGMEPPIITKILIGVSVIIREYYAFICILNLFILLIILYKIKTSIKLKNKIDVLKLKMPFIRNITKLIMTTKFSRAFYILNKSGVEITEAIEISSQVIDNHVLDKEISKCKESIMRGNTIGESLSIVQVFPKLFLNMIKIGEESGKLDNSLEAINKFYEQELESKIEQNMKLIEPAIIVVIGIFMGALVISMLMPMFDTISSI
ncbi:MAG: type II secretion system F family protein [Peptostreptococcaceae bacterium]